MSSYIHTVIIYVVLCIFVFLVYTPSSVPALGSPGQVPVPCPAALPELPTTCRSLACPHIIRRMSLPSMWHVIHAPSAHALVLHGSMLRLRLPGFG